MTDHSDLSNGSAEIFPTNSIVVWAHLPVDGLALSDYDDWLEVVITHELAHIFHLDHAGWLGGAVRTVFRRVPWTWPAFPGYAGSFLAIEGVAVHRESLHTRAIVRQRARHVPESNSEYGPLLTGCPKDLPAKAAPRDQWGNERRVSAGQARW